jgi:hypothetical protein
MTILRPSACACGVLRSLNKSHAAWAASSALRNTVGDGDGEVDAARGAGVESKVEGLLRMGRVPAMFPV